MGDKTMHQHRCHLSQMHTTNYMPWAYIWEKVAYRKKTRANRGGGGAPFAPLNPPLVMVSVSVRFDGYQCSLGAPP